VIVSGHKANARDLPGRRGRNLLARYHVKQKSGAKKSAFGPSCGILEAVDFVEGAGAAAGMAEAPESQMARSRGLKPTPVRCSALPQPTDPPKASSRSASC
jgi:hypothetical protein